MPHMDLDVKINANPTVFKRAEIKRNQDHDGDDSDATDPFDVTEIYELLRDISDPEVRGPDSRALLWVLCARPGYPSAIRAAPPTGPWVLQN